MNNCHPPFFCLRCRTSFLQGLHHTLNRLSASSKGFPYAFMPSPTATPQNLIGNSYLSRGWCTAHRQSKFQLLRPRPVLTKTLTGVE